MDLTTDEGGCVHAVVRELVAVYDQSVAIRDHWWTGGAGCGWGHEMHVDLK
jgi:hypothetical protein